MRAFDFCIQLVQLIFIAANGKVVTHVNGLFIFDYSAFLLGNVFRELVIGKFL